MKIWIPVVLTLACCSGTAHNVRSYPEPKPEEIAAYLHGIRDRAPSLTAETVSDLRLGKDRLKLTVFFLAAWGGKLRMQAMNPNDTLAADLASDGKSFEFLDVLHNCGDSGPATPENVASMIRIALEPDDLVAVLLGSTPLIEDPAPTVKWDSSSGAEVLTLKKDDCTQTVELDGKPQQWDVVDSKLVCKDNTWEVRHKDFHTVGGIRLPGASLFTQGSEIVKIVWKSQKVDAQIPDGKFQLAIQPGIPQCK
jgi:hypothetical protein